jgi:hypothetical protein
MRTENVMTTHRTRTVLTGAVGVGLTLGGLALGVAALAGSSAQQVTDNAESGASVWTNTQGVNTVGTVGIPFIDILPGDADGNTVVESPAPSIAIPEGPGNTIVWFPGGAIVTGSTFVF